MKYLAAVRYGLLAHTENFQSNVENLRSGAEVIVRTNRGMESGVIVGAVTAIDREVKGIGEILRLATEADRAICKHIREVKEPEEFQYCDERIRERDLPMRLVAVEHLFSGDKIVFYFLAESRVDFRELVRDLARRYRTRIEMRQIGVRDEARIVGDYERCGLELCCRTFLRQLEQVTMRMAKIQKTTLDPAKISGHCGRLMCCLRYEDQVYSEMRRDMPERGAIVATVFGEGEVVKCDLFKQMVTVLFADGSSRDLAASEVIIRRARRSSVAEISKDDSAEDGADDGIHGRNGGVEKRDGS